MGVLVRGTNKHIALFLYFATTWTITVVHRVPLPKWPLSNLMNCPTWNTNKISPRLRARNCRKTGLQNRNRCYGGQNRIVVESAIAGGWAGDMNLLTYSCHVLAVCCTASIACEKQRLFSRVLACLANHYDMFEILWSDSESYTVHVASR